MEQSNICCPAHDQRDRFAKYNLSITRVVMGEKKMEKVMLYLKHAGDGVMINSEF